MKGEISVVINTLNEEENIEAAIKSAKRISDDIVVVDMHSDDKTAKLAKKCGARVYKHERTGYVEPARNFAIEKARNDWIFVLDADERIPKSLAKRIERYLANGPADYYAVPRKNIIFGKWIKHSRWWPDYNIRFFKKGKVVWDNNIHSIPITHGKGADMPSVNANYAIKHYHYTSVEQYIERLNRYTTIQAKESEEFKWQNLIASPVREFNSRYFAGMGYKDGLHGLALAFLQAFSELIVELKVWQKFKFIDKKIENKTVIKEIRKTQKEINYWTANTLIEKSIDIKEKIRRKFKI